MIDWEVASGCEFEGFFKLLSSWTPTTVKGGSAPQMTTPLPLDPVDPADPLHALINSKFDLVLQQQGAQQFDCVRCPESGIQWCWCCPVNCIYKWRHNQQSNRICYICKCNSLFCWLDMKPMCFHKNHLYFEAPQKAHKKTHIRWHFLRERKTPRHCLILSQNDACYFYSVSMFFANCPDTFLTLGRKRQICADTILILFPIHQEIHPDTIFDTFNGFSCFIV